jgi:hypothetical protein
LIDVVPVCAHSVVSWKTFTCNRRFDRLAKRWFAAVRHPCLRDVFEI